MSRQLHLLISDRLDLAITKAAEQSSSSKEHWIVRILEEAAVERDSEAPASLLADLDASATEFEPMLSEGESATAYRERRDALERLFQLFEGHDAEAEIRQLKLQDQGF